MPVKKAEPKIFFYIIHGEISTFTGWSVGWSEFNGAYNIIFTFTK